IHPRTSHADIMANPKRNRAMLLTYNTDTKAKTVTADGYFYQKPSYPTYHCENPVVAPNVAAVTTDLDTFARHALTMLDDANEGAIPLNF
ncbi:MAG: hypothetical protein WA906_06755, partial [Pacificimonas sp.]